MKRKFTQRILKKSVNKIKISELDIRFRFVYIKVNDKTQPVSCDATAVIRIKRYLEGNLYSSLCENLPNPLNNCPKAGGNNKKQPAVPLLNQNKL